MFLRVLTVHLLFFKMLSSSLFTIFFLKFLSFIHYIFYSLGRHCEKSTFKPTCTLPDGKPALPVNLYEDPASELFSEDSSSFMLDGTDDFPIIFGRTMLEFTDPSDCLQHNSTLGSQNCS